MWDPSWSRRGAAALAAIAAVTLAAGCGSSSSSSSGSASVGDTPVSKNAGSQVNGRAGDIRALCGTKPVVVGYLKSAGGNTWVTQSAAEFRDEAAKCPTIKRAMFSQAINDQQKAISDINSFVAQGVNVIVISADYGPAELPAIRRATQAGVKVVTILGNAGGKPGTDFVDSVVFDTDSIGKQWVDFIHEQLPKGGKVTYLGGTPGNETSTAFFAGVSTALKQYPNVELVPDRINDTNWDPAQKQRVMTGLLSKYGRIDAVVTDFNGTDAGVVSAYQKAGMKPPVFASITPSNQIGCQWRRDPYPFIVMGQTSSMTRLGLRLGLAAAEGKTDAEAGRLRPPAFVYTTGGKRMACNLAYPPDADLTADLTPAQLTSLFGK
jgi:ribose transport system substrate-binding protein